MFKIGDKVQNIQLGPISKGTIYQVLEPNMYKPGRTLQRWDLLYPNWENEPIAYIRWDNPTAICTEEERLWAIEHGFNCGETKHVSEYPLFTEVALPFKDLELVK